MILLNFLESFFVWPIRSIWHWWFILFLRERYLTCIIHVYIFILALWWFLILTWTFPLFKTGLATSCLWFWWLWFEGIRGKKLSCDIRKQSMTHYRSLSLQKQIIARIHLTYVLERRSSSNARTTLIRLRISRYCCRLTLMTQDLRLVVVASRWTAVWYHW